MSLLKKHRDRTKELLDSIAPAEIGRWLLNHGYFPEENILPPSFKVDEFDLEANVKLNDILNLSRRSIESITYPKTTLTSREFGLQHPTNYHDIVFHIISEWEEISNILFNNKNKIYSYSFPIPLNARDIGNLSTLRTGRMIYEWIAMAEKDLVVEAHNFNLIVRSDVTNFYNSVYTHSIGWAIHGEEDSFNDSNTFHLFGNKIDKLVQYANQGRTNGLPVGSALSDLIAEIILSRVDTEVTIKIDVLGIEYIATRFKDDYRFLCNTTSDAELILKILASELKKFNLSINESKTKILDLPSGLYRQHDRLYHPISIKSQPSIDFKSFEINMLNVLDIHRKFPGTSILEKFFSELFDADYNTKLQFSHDASRRRKEIMKTFSLLMLVKRQSAKVLCHALALIEHIYIKYYREHLLKPDLQKIISTEIKEASEKKSVFELIWLIYFSRYISLGITNLSELVSEENRNNVFVKSIIKSKQEFFKDSGIKLFRKPKECKGTPLARTLAAFERNKE